MKKLIIGGISLGLALSLSVPVFADVPIDTPKIEMSTTTSWVVKVPPPTIHELIATYSNAYGVSSVKMTKVLTCESKLNPRAVGDGGHSFGVAQIYLPAHPEVTKAQALDPEWAIEWMAKAFSKGKASMWSCYNLLYD